MDSILLLGFLWGWGTTQTDLGQADKACLGGVVGSLDVWWDSRVAYDPVHSDSPLSEGGFHVLGVFVSELDEGGVHCQHDPGSLEAQNGSEQDQDEDQQLCSPDPVHAQIIVLNDELVDESEDAA